MPEPTEKHREEARRLASVAAERFDANEESVATEWMADDIFAALAAAEERGAESEAADADKVYARGKAHGIEVGRREALQKAALLPRKWKHAENVRQQIGNHVSEDTASDIAWIATVIEADIRALIPQEPKP